MMGLSFFFLQRKINNKYNWFELYLDIFIYYYFIWIKFFFFFFLVASSRNTLVNLFQPRMCLGKKNLQKLPIYTFKLRWLYQLKLWSLTNNYVNINYEFWLGYWFIHFNIFCIDKHCVRSIILSIKPLIAFGKSIWTLN